MKILLKGGVLINVFTGELEETNVLIEDSVIIGVGDYDDVEADIVSDVRGKYICPGFIDGHIHIESTMLTPSELARLCLPHGTTTIVADPHEIANVCGTDGIRYMIEASEGIPFHVYINLPSCVPATSFDEAGAVLRAEDLKPFYREERVLGLGEVMNYPGVLHGDEDLLQKIADARSFGKHIDGHAPCVLGKELDKYILHGIENDHECSTMKEAVERIRKGQWLMIRQGTAARNLDALLPLFDSKYNHRCLLVTDDLDPSDIMTNGHIDKVIRYATNAGKSVITAIKMATIQAAECFGLYRVGAVAPGYRADVLVLDDLETVKVRDVYVAGKKIVDDGVVAEFAKPKISARIEHRVKNSFNLKELSPEDFYIEKQGEVCRVIEVLSRQILTREVEAKIDFSVNNGVSIDEDILKLAVIERHNNTSHKGVGFVKGIGLKKGAIASSVSHDSHNLVVIGTNDADMAVAANHIRKTGGNVVVVDGKVIADMQLPIAGLISDIPGEEIAKANFMVREAVEKIGTNPEIEPFMNMAFVSLPVIPSLKMTTKGLVKVEEMRLVSLFK